MLWNIEPSHCKKVVKFETKPLETPERIKTDIMWLKKGKREDHYTDGTTIYFVENVIIYFRKPR